MLASMGQLNFKINDEDERLIRELAEDRGVSLKDLLRQLAAEARRRDERFIKQLTEKYGTEAELEIAVNHHDGGSIGIGTFIAGVEGEASWLPPDEIAVVARLDDARGTFDVRIGTPGGESSIFVADVDARHGTKLRFPLASLYPHARAAVSNQEAPPHE